MILAPILATPPASSWLVYDFALGFLARAAMVRSSLIEWMRKRSVGTVAFPNRGAEVRIEERQSRAIANRPV